MVPVEAQPCEASERGQGAVGNLKKRILLLVCSTLCQIFTYKDIHADAPFGYDKDHQTVEEGFVSTYGQITKLSFEASVELKNDAYPYACLWVGYSKIIK